MPQYKAQKEVHYLDLFNPTAKLITKWKTISSHYSLREAVDAVKKYLANEKGEARARVATPSGIELVWTQEAK